MWQQRVVINDDLMAEDHFCAALKAFKENNIITFEASLFRLWNDTAVNGEYFINKYSQLDDILARLDGMISKHPQSKHLTVHDLIVHNRVNWVRRHGLILIEYLRDKNKIGDFTYEKVIQQESADRAADESGV